MEVDASALRRNLGRIRASVGPDTGLVPMVKADAYGLGMEAAVGVLSTESPWAFGVATVGEGRRLRAAGWAGRALLLSPVSPGEVDAALDAHLTLSVSDLRTLEQLRSLAEGGRRATFHLEIDTGMGRAGFDWRDAAAWGGAARAAEQAGARWEAIFTHLHSADEDAASVRGQWTRLQGALAALGDGAATKLVHVLNSPGAFRCPDLSGDLVRPGIFLYGGEVGSGLPAPEPVVALRSRVVRVRQAGEGDTVGYGVTHVARGPERWATIALGYGDGLPRALGNRGVALLRGRRVPIIGRISMDVCVVDMTGVGDVAPGDVATFIGSDGDERITVDEIAKTAGTISYEILTGITGRVPRIWSDEHDG
jgi:alanine racemase